MSTAHLADLNPEQRQAAETTEGPLLVLAGAGSGKTRVITHRIVHLILNGVAPHHILAVTFTNKAATEMRERVEALIREHAGAARAGLDSLPTVTTFHALGVRILREHHATLNLRRHFTIYDRSDSVRAIKKSLEAAGYSPKQFEPRNVLSMISRAKGDALSRSEYLERASKYPERVAADVWEHYDIILKEDGALDFDDLLLKTMNLLRSYPVIRQHLQERFQYIHVDEYQDTNRVQFAIVKLLAGERQNVCAVGDIDQCLVADTQVTMADGTPKKIASIKVGDAVLSNYGSGDMRPATVSRVHKRNVRTNLTTITTDNGRTLTSTAEHLHFANYRLGVSPQYYFVYLMYKHNVGWRLGTSQVYTKGRVKSRVGFWQRTTQEHGDAAWVISTHETESAARVMECVLSVRYQLPTIPFIARPGRSTNGFVHDQEMVTAIYQQLDTHTAAQTLLRDYHLSEAYPHHRPQVSKSQRQNIIVTLCGDRRSQTPMHRLSIAGSNQRIKQVLHEHGFSVRSAKAGSESWRYETASASLADITARVTELRQLLPEATVRTYARLGTQERVRDTNSLLCLPAAAVRPGMMLFDETGGNDTVATVETTLQQATVCDIDVAPTHNFIANGLATHNSIYSWRGASIENVMQFEKEFPGARTVFLEENYRSTQTIINASNDIIAKNQNRIPKTVFTNNHPGEPITLFAAMTGADEAEYVVMTVKSLLADGVSPSEIAVLYRTNFQSRALEEAFLNFEVPYQLLGTKFFERKEVKDVLSFLRLAFNPGSTADLARIINVPTRGIGKVTLLKLLENKRDELKGATLQKVERFEEMMVDIADQGRTEPISKTVKFILKRTGLEADLKKEGTEESLTRLENLQELVTMAARYDELPPEEGIEALLENAALQSDQDELAAKEARDAVRLMTVHAAKGLEFPYVFITGLEEGLFPHERLDDKGVDHEEERRLFYVALTRAQKKVFLTYAHMRTIFGSQRVNVPSSFLQDISAEHIDGEDSRGDTSSGFERTIFID